jgi:hypothetical protein
LAHGGTKNPRESFGYVECYIAMLNGWSKMTIVMIPKVTNPENVTEF